MSLKSPELEKALKTVASIIAETAVYIQSDSEPMRVDFNDTEDESFTATGEISGQEYFIAYSEVNITEDMFYKFALIDINK